MRDWDSQRNQNFVHEKLSTRATFKVRPVSYQFCVHTENSDGNNFGEISSESYLIHWSLLDAQNLGSLPGWTIGSMQLRNRDGSYYYTTPLIEFFMSFTCIRGRSREATAEAAGTAIAQQRKLEKKQVYGHGQCSCACGLFCFPRLQVFPLFVLSFHSTSVNKLFM